MKFTSIFFVFLTTAVFWQKKSDQAKLKRNTVQFNRSVSNFIFLFFTLIFFACNPPSKEHGPKSTTDVVIKDGNKTTIISTDTTKLGHLLNFKIYQPIGAKFKYEFIDNSGQNDRPSVPGPSDSFLEAVLYFDSLTFSKILNFDKSADYPALSYGKDEFMFDWLDAQIVSELMKSDTNYHGHPDFFFCSMNSQCWYLHEKILIRRWTN